MKTSVILFVILSVCLLGGTVWYALRKGASLDRASWRRALAVNLCSLALVTGFVCLVPAVTARAEGEDAAVAAQTETTTTQEVGSRTTNPDSAAAGWAYIAAALTTGLACLGGGYAVAKGATAAIGATGEDPKVFGKALIFVTLGEGIAIYGLLISFMILGKVG